MVGVETRRSVAAIGGRGEIFACVIVHDAGEIALVVVLPPVGAGSLFVDDRPGQFVVVLRQHVAFGSRQQVNAVLVGLVTQHHIEVMVADLLGVVENLLQVEVEIPLMPFRDHAFFAGELSEPGIRNRGGAGFVERNAGVEREFEILEEGDVDISRTVESIAFGFLFVETRIREGVAVGEERTLHTGIVAVAVVVELDAVLVVHDITLAVADVERIDRTDGRRISENVARRVTGAAVVDLVVAEMRVVGIGAELEPLLGLIVHAQTGRITVHVRVVGDTFVVQIAERSVDRGVPGLAGDRSVVLLTQGRAESRIGPVVGTDVVLLALIDETAAESRSGIDLTVDADELLPGRNRIDHIAQTSVIRIGRQIRIGAQMGLADTHSRIDIVVFQRTVMQFVKLCRVGDVRIILDGARIDAPLGVDCHVSLLRLGLFGGDHHHAVGAAGAVQRVRGGVLQHGHRFDVTRVEVVQVSRVRHAVHDPERIVAGVERTETADADRRTLSRLSRGVGQLHARDLSGQSLRYVRLLRLGDVVRFDDGRRTGESLLFCRTERYDDHVVDSLCVLFQHDVDPGLRPHLDRVGLITHERHDQHIVRCGFDRKTAVRTGGRTLRSAFDQNGGADDAGPRMIFDRTRNFPFLRMGGQEQAENSHQ